MMIITYQPRGGRDGDQFIQEFTDWYEKLDIHTNTHTALFRPGLSIGDVRGKMMFILRPTSVDEQLLSDASRNLIKGKDFLVIDGWGTLQDKWKLRGYSVTSQVGTAGSGTMEENMMMRHSSGTGAPTFKPLLTKGVADYTYQTNQEFSAWVQEWPRVVEKDTELYLFRKYSASDIKYYYYWVHWGESYNEKLQDAKDTFDKSIADKTNQSSVYINSLCGYFIDKGKKETCKPVNNLSGDGMGTWGVTYGNLIDFSEKINNDFYNYVLDKSDTQGSLSGPVGVVMINRVGTTDASRMMPNVIISNNFKFPLLTKDPSAGKTNGNAYQKGGDAIN